MFPVKDLKTYSRNSQTEKGPQGKTIGESLSGVSGKNASEGRVEIDMCSQIKCRDRAAAQDPQGRVTRSDFLLFCPTGKC